ncbi:MAG: dihydroxyacetone kinase, partial [bacterium]
MPDRLDAAGILRWLTAASAELNRQRQAIDALNVFPVADNDTGTNLAATVAGARAAGHGTNRGPGAGGDMGPGAGGDMGPGAGGDMGP